MSDRAEGVRVAQPLFQEAGDGSTPISALQLRCYVIDHGLAKQLNRLWHSRLPALTSPQCRIAYGAEYENLYYAVAVWCRPIARLLPQTTWLELQRLAIAPDAPRNTASRLLGWMARDIRKRFPDVVRLISYQDTEVHTGGIYLAAGWTAQPEGKFSPWDDGPRARNAAQSTANKVRWEKEVSR